MTEADLYPHLAHLAGGQVYPYVVPLLDGRPSAEGSRSTTLTLPHSGTFTVL